MDTDPGDPKECGSGRSVSGFGSGTLVNIIEAGVKINEDCMRK
jgi:hypothetical protein